jgi:hypothetical protein
MKRQRLAGVLAAVLALTLLAAPVATAAAGDTGVEGASFAGAASGTTGEKPESKLWFADGSWWSVLYDPGTTDHHIFELVPATQTWRDTGVVTDNRPGTKADVLLVPETGKLYVVSHVFSTSTKSGYPSRLFRYSYAPGTRTWTLDSGFPATVNDARSESLVIARDGIGRLWATWVQGTTLRVTHTVCTPTCDDRRWATPFVPAVAGTTVTTDDISSVIAMQDGRIGVMWSNQSADAFYFAVHEDGAAPDAWLPSEVALSGPDMADDHVNLALHPSGRVLAAVKTSRAVSTDPLVGVLDRSTSGTWTFHTFGRYRDHHTRPIIQLDAVNDVVHVLATSGESGGTIFRKSAPAGAISFPVGLGDVFMQDADANDLNNPTGTKQLLGPQSGMLVLASHQTTKRYWHAFDPLGGSPPVNVAPVAAADEYAVGVDDELVVAAPGVLANDSDLDGQPLTASLVSQPINASVALAADGGFRFTPEPGFVGTATFQYVASDGEATSDPATVTVEVTEPSQHVVLTPTDDSYVRSNYPADNYGSATTLRTYRGGSNQTDAYLRFTNTSGQPVTKAVLRLRVTDGSPAGGTLRSVADTTWTESTLTWNNRPALGDEIGSIGAVTAGTWVELDVTSLVTGAGTYSFAVTGLSSDAAFFASSETADAPELVLTTASS